MDELTTLVERYMALLKASVPTASDAIERSLYAERLSAAGEIAEALRLGDVGRAASIANEEERSIGLGSFPAGASRSAHNAFLKLREVITDARLKGAPDAGFQH